MHEGSGEDAFFICCCLIPFVDAAYPPYRGLSCERGGMLVISLRGVNFRFWS